MDRGIRVEGGFGTDRAFKRGLRDDDLAAAQAAMKTLFGEEIAVIDPMSGGGSIPLESARMGLKTYANELNPVACTTLEATIDFPFRFGPALAERARFWGVELIKRIDSRLSPFFPKKGFNSVHAYIFARTIPCPDTQHHTPLVHDWHLSKARGSELRIVADPIVDREKGTWAVRIREIGTGAGKIKEAPHPTSGGGDGISLFTGSKIPNDYIEAQAQNGNMGSALYAVAVKTPNGLAFEVPSEEDITALKKAELELALRRKDWENRGIIPTEEIPPGVQPGNRLQIGGIRFWADMFSPRQLLGLGVIVEELKNMYKDISAAEGEQAEAIQCLLSLALDKYINWNAILATWNAPFGTMRSVFDKHGYNFRATFGEMAPCGAGAGLAWALENCFEAFESIAKLPRVSNVIPTVTLGSATSLAHIDAGTISAVVVDPPYDDNVQYAELANFFYVWLKRTFGVARPDWFATRLVDWDEEAVNNFSRHRADNGKRGDAKKMAQMFYREKMRGVFTEAKRVLRDDGALTVMFTHKKQEAWEALFSSLISAGFTITATWPVKTESEHSLHQAKKNAAQSTVILVARKRPAGAGTGYYNDELRAEIRQKARATAERLKIDGLNAVDQLVGSFGPAMEVYSRYDVVKTDTGELIGVSAAIDEASEAVSQWRIEQLAERGLEGVEPEGKFALLCWDVLGAAEFRYNEASLLGKAVGMEVDTLIAAGLVTKSGDKIKVVPVKERRRDRALEQEEADLLGAPIAGKRRKKADALKVHPNDPSFRTALDGCHALALRYLEAGGGAGGVGNARELSRRQNWQKGSIVARLLEALVHAAPEAVRHDDGKKTSAAALFPEFRAWHALLQPLFGVAAPDWTPRAEPQFELALIGDEQAEIEVEDEEESED